MYHPLKQGKPKYGICKVAFELQDALENTKCDSHKRAILEAFKV